MRKATRKSGFTLIEVTMVVAIIALLIGGILAGVSLVRTSKIQSVMADINSYKSAINAFEEKYNCMPGDCLKATDYFGAQDPTPATCQITASTGTLTCNGDGNGYVGDNTPEMFRFWQHLAIAGYIKGKYTGIAGPYGSGNHIADVNSPSASFANSAIGFSYANYLPGDGATYGMNYGHLFWFGKLYEDGNNRPQNSILTPGESLSFDKKFDDGMPGTGLIIARSNEIYWTDPNACTTSANATDYSGSYNISSTIISCSFLIRISAKDNN